MRRVRRESEEIGEGERGEESDVLCVLAGNNNSSNNSNGTWTTLHAR